MTLGERIKGLREDNLLSQVELAYLIDTTQENISNYENDKRVPGFRIYAKMLIVFDISNEKFIEPLDLDKVS